jgi:hypothetical protein
MTNHSDLSPAAVAIILAGVAMLAMLLTLAIGAFGQPERNYIAPVFGLLAVILAGASLAIVLIKLQI